MVKGVNKLIVEVSNPGSEYFERAIFFVKPQMKDTPVKELNENANALINAVGRKSPKAKQEPQRAGLLFAGAAGFGAAIAAILIKLVS